MTTKGEENSLPPVIVSAPRSGSASWEDCERKFGEMTRAFKPGNMPAFHKLAAEYDAMLDIYERTQETPNSYLTETNLRGIKE